MPRYDMGTYKKWKIGNDIRKLLLSNPKVVAAVGQNIFPLVAPENVDGDFITYSRDSYGKEYVKQGLYEDTCTEEILIISDVYDNAVNIAEIVDEALSGRHLLENGKTIQLTVQTSSETFQDNKYIERIVFGIE